MWCRLSPPGWRTSRIGSCQSCWRAGAQEHHFSKGLTPCPAPAAWWLATRPCTNHAVSWEEPFVSCNFQGQEMGSLLPVRRETELWGQGFSWFCERQAACARWARISWISKEKAGGKHQHFRRRRDFKIAPGTASAHPIYMGSKKRAGGILNHLLPAGVLLGLQWSQALVAMNSVILCKPADLPGGKDVALLCSRIFVTGCNRLLQEHKICELP